MTVGIRVDIEDKNDLVIIRLDGRLDAATASQLETKIASYLTKEKIKLIIDFMQVDYLSSAGMRLLLSATKKTKAHNSKIAFVSIQADVMEIIKMAGFEKILPIYNSEAEAISRLKSHE